MLEKIAHFYEGSGYSMEEWSKGFQRYVDCGVTDFVFTAPWVALMVCNGQFLKTVKKLQMSCGIRFTSAHLPFADKWDLLEMDDSNFEAAMWMHSQAIQLLSNEFGIRCATIHLMNKLYEKTVDQALEQVEKPLNVLLKVAEQNDFVLCIENGFQPVDYPDTLPLYLKKYANPHFGITLDLAHAHIIANRFGKSLPGMIETLSPYLTIVHLHDNNGVDDLHRVPGWGNIDWARIMPLFKKCPKIQSLQAEANLALPSIEEICARYDMLYKMI